VSALRRCQTEKIRRAGPTVSKKSDEERPLRGKAISARRKKKGPKIYSADANR